MIRTIEIRWIFDKPLPQFAGWSERRPVQTHFYAPIADIRSSVKLRSDGLEPRLETKFWMRDVGEFQVWSKLSLPIAPDKSDAIVVLAENNWLTVSKERWLKFYRRDQSPVWKEVDESESEDSVQAEWSRICVADRPSFTFSLEAAVSEVQSPEVKQHLVRSLLEQLLSELEISEQQLPARQSYPKYLQMFAR